MPELTSFIKDPQAVLDYAHDYTAWLNGDTLATHTVIMPAAPVDDLTPLVKDSSIIDGARVVIWLSGGTNRRDYPITVRVTTAGGRTDDRTTRIYVTER